MNKDEKEKLWNSICSEVEKEVERTYLDIPVEKRRQLRIEPDKDGKFSDVDTYDRNRLVVCYISLIEWQKRAKLLFGQQFVFKEDT
ncbi:MAG: hypothetical protein CMQ41_12455 [Gammaproteobacteria bacterium]|nr:hypothetical protein [Gammaproteobacteria bacterium]|tara:strand:- start:140 stop:397 length:258 start_codon:yes stop_codon:yes gene_type:complete